MIKLTQVDWSTGEKTPICVNPTNIMFMSTGTHSKTSEPITRIVIQGYDLKVVETLEEIIKIINEV